MTFTGFGEAVVDFYEGLEADNSKAYWADHKAVYDEHVRAPMVALLADLEPEFGEGRIFRPYRDLRFSADKTPYKTHIGATAGPRYVQVSAEGLMVAAGYYAMTSAQIARYRAAVGDERHGTALAAIVDDLRAEGFSVSGEQLRTRPRGADPDHPRLELLRHKSLYGWRSWPPSDELHGPALRDRVATTWRRLAPLGQWLDEHVGVDLDDTADRPGRRRR
ncbi:DUF2461 domain-containing protein [Actinomycetospora cinnamomea]|uniref:Uncharacterized protein (TIGR02453 family) n=1 Tax=Actinomycetospora cinnamomea TaxID=663609 RepID=A0A2U1FAI3_9PSEU|nr:DUF2461 domain-containing protein [Actinomycetospora cinnamomea]PVZ08980.1 uncharacterized protein (TIGR02453 family) [Actinomycetospora cinnamomea]